MDATATFELDQPMQLKGEIIDFEFTLGGDVDHRKRRRNRTTQSCLNCHTSKRKVRPSIFISVSIYPTLSSSSSVALVRPQTALFEVHTARPGMLSSTYPRYRPPLDPSSSLVDRAVRV